VSCPAEARLAAAASGEDAGVLDHARECLVCRAALIEQRELLSAVRMLAKPALRPERRAALAAEVMAASDIEAPRWPGARVMAIAAGLAAAAAIAMIVVATRAPVGTVPAAPDIATLDEPAIRSAGSVFLEPVAAPLRATVVSTGADFARALRGDDDVLVLRDGELSIDATDREPVTVVAGDTRVTIASSRAKVVARHGVIVTTHVFAGTAEVTANGRSRVIDAGDVWMREPEASPTETPANDSLAAFRQGWEALRAHDHPHAIAAFDRATDPVVAEDAAFWAAIATERAGDLDGAAARLRAFLERFPTSPRAETARAALVRVTQ
jgi:hypothetical protein